jgi:hypothetical protein
MKKRILCLVAALAVAAMVVTPANAAVKKYNSSEFEGTTANQNTKVNTIVDGQTGVSSAQSDIKPSGAAGAKVSVVTGSAKDNLMDNGIKPCVKEFVKATEKGEAGKGKVGVSQLRGIFYFDLTADQTGDVTFKVDADGDAAQADACNGDQYAIVLHYTGNAADEDGITAQYCKISAAGKVTAHFNSFSPVAIITTTSTSAQQLVNTYSHSAGSDAGNAPAAATTTTTTTAAPVQTTTTDVTPVENPAGAAPANGKGAASPKTSDNAYALYLILAVAAVAGTTLVATKKTR